MLTVHEPTVSSPTVSTTEQKYAKSKIQELEKTIELVSLFSHIQTRGYSADEISFKKVTFSLKFIKIYHDYLQ